MTRRRRVEDQEIEVLLSNRKSDNRCGRLVEILLITPAEERRFVLMNAFQTGELRLSEADEVMALVRRIEALNLFSELSSGANYALGDRWTNQRFAGGDLSDSFRELFERNVLL